LEALTTTVFIKERRDLASIGWVLWIGAGIGFLLLLHNGEYLGAAAAPFFGFLGAWMALGFGWVELGPRGARRGCPLGVWEIRWEEVQTVGTDGMTLVLHGPAKHLPLVPSYWRGPEAEEGLKLLLTEVECRGIPTERDDRASFRVPWNVRVKPRSPSLAA
jgi:hypothetical protein